MIEVIYHLPISISVYKQGHQTSLLTSYLSYEQVERVFSNKFEMWVYMLLITVVVAADAARILGFFPTPSISHQVAFRPLTQELARRGHEVIVVTTDPAFRKGQAPANLTEIDVHDISYEAWRKSILSTTTGKSGDLFTQMDSVLYTYSVIFKQQILTKEVQDLIRNKNNTFDLLLVEMCARQSWVLTHIFKTPAVFVSSLGGIFGVYETVGAPNHQLLYPALIRQKIINLSFWEKLIELYNYYYFENVVFESNVIRENELNKKLFGPDIPLAGELIKNMEMLFLNVHPIWEGNRPVPPNVVFMGGIHQNSQKDLPKELKTYLDSSKNGVIYISFGTNVMPSMLPPERIQILTNVFSKLPYDVLWKYDKDELPGRSKNIRLEKWLPQADLLRHPKVKLFITQGGLQSTDEAITAGVPMVGVPMLGDQWYNVDHYVQHKIGVRVDMETITEENFMNAIKTVVNDDSYRQNIIRLRELMNDQPQKPLERAVWWAEHVIRHKGAKHLKSAAAHLTWAQYYEIEFLSILLAIVVSIVLFVSFVIYSIWKYVVRNFITTVKFKKS